MIEDLAAYLRDRYAEARANGQALLEAQPETSPLADVAFPDFFDATVSEQRAKVATMVDQLNADLDSKLAIVELCATETTETGGKPLALRTLLLLAQPFGHRPDFPEAWRQ